MKNKLLFSLIIALIGISLRILILPLFEEENSFIKLTAIVSVFVIGIYTLKGAADIIEETTEILSEKTKLASGLLQSIGTAFPDMVLGIIAALISLRLAKTDYAAAVNYAIIAAATTFGSNIYNIAYATWCISRQNLANKLNKNISMLPGVKAFGELTPIFRHKNIPGRKELETSLDILNILTWITALVAILMVAFGKVKSPAGFNGDLYQLIQPAGLVVLVFSIGIMYKYRETKKEKHDLVLGINLGEKYFATKPLLLIWTALVFSGIAILTSAEVMVHALNAFSFFTGIPSVISGAFAGIIGCLGEMIVIHNYSINPQGRIADALVGVGMDNIVTTLGASIVAIIGGIFLGGESLIVIFVLILSFNTLLIWQIGKLERMILTRSVV